MIPPASDAIWRRVLTSESDLSKASLATRILMGRLRREVGSDRKNMDRCVGELRGFFETNTFATRDLAHLS